MTQSSRTDAFGKAVKGSQYQLQVYVNQYGELFERELAILFGDASLTFEWLSPLEQDNYTEYRDGAALKKLGLSSLDSELREFWPMGGPRWDALALAHTPQATYRVLFEAKSHLAELASICTATDAASRKKIRISLHQTQERLGCITSVDWMTVYYQYANRMAHLCWLGDRVETRLVNIYFVDDPYEPTSLADWQTGLQAMKEQLSLNAPPTGMYELFLPARGYA